MSEQNNQSMVSTEETFVVKQGGNVCGFFAFFLTAIYAVYIVSYFADLFLDSLSGYLATAIVTPHLLCIILATVFSGLGRFGHKRWGMLTAGILLAVSAVLMMTYAPMVILQCVLCFVAYARMGIVYKEKA